MCIARRQPVEISSCHQYCKIIGSTLDSSEASQIQSYFLSECNIYNYKHVVRFLQWKFCTKLNFPYIFFKGMGFQQCYREPGQLNVKLFLVCIPKHRIVSQQICCLLSWCCLEGPDKSASKTASKTTICPKKQMFQ